MTREEALKHAKREQEAYHRKAQDRPFYKDAAEFWDIVRDALEKTTPKSPKINHYEGNGEKPYIKISCPNGCHIQLSPVTEKRLAYEHVCCPKCGQAIDWREVVDCQSDLS